MKKSFNELTVKDVAKRPVWKFTNNDQNELEIESVRSSSHSDLNGLIVASPATFADGTVHWVLFQNLSLKRPQENEHFLTLTVDCNGQWFSLARYHDIEIDTFGPAALAAAMAKQVEDIFPIRYDLQDVLKTRSHALAGEIRSEPLNPLTRSEIISLAVARTAPE